MSIDDQEGITKVQFTPTFKSVVEGIVSGCRIVAEEGSMRSGKTYAILQALILLSFSPEQFCEVAAKALGKTQEEIKKSLAFLLAKKNGFAIKAFRKKSTTARQSIWKDAKKILADMGFLDRCKVNETMMTVNFSNGNEFMCCGADEPDKYHSVAQDIVYFCEAIDFKEEVFNQVNGRTTFLVIIDFNPRVSRHWVYTKILKRPKSELHHHHSTYKDNAFLEQAQVDEIENWQPTPENYAKGTADAWLWQVYGEGKRGIREGVIFDPRSWDICPDDEFPHPHNCLRYGFGLDFGFGIDPTALIECALSNDILYLREVVYETKLLVQINTGARWQRSLIGILYEKNFKKDDVIIADSAAPESIAQMVYSGFNCRGVRKFDGSIVEGLQRIKGRKIRVCESSLGVQYELENYCWKSNKSTGESYDIPDDKDNHAVDAIRYWGLENLSPSQTAQHRQRHRPNITQGKKRKKW